MRVVRPYQTRMYGWQSQPPSPVYVTIAKGVKHLFSRTRALQMSSREYSIGPYGILHMIAGTLRATRRRYVSSRSNRSGRRHH